MEVLAHSALDLSARLLTRALEWNSRLRAKTKELVDRFDLDATALVGPLVAILLLYVLYRALRTVHKLLFVPLNHVRYLDTIGYYPTDEIDSKKQLANWVQRQRAIGDVPPAYPNGWFALVESFRLHRGCARTVHICGLALAVFRDDNGVPHVLDAYCPHLGADLGAGGQVVGECLQCPFHGWEFRGSDGQCVKIPYASKIPASARVKSWPTVEKAGWVCFWYDAEGREPLYELDDIPEVPLPDYAEGANKRIASWYYAGRTENYVNCHICEIPENGGDFGHFPFVHKTDCIVGRNLRNTVRHWSQWLSHNTWTASWEADPDRREVGVLNLELHWHILGFHIKPLDIGFRTMQIGPAVVHINMMKPFAIGSWVQVVQPIEPLMQRFIHHFYIHKFVPMWIAKLGILWGITQVERDIQIWNNKKFVRRPLLVRSEVDAVLSRHRTWYNQFYSEHSPRMLSAGSAALASRASAIQENGGGACKCGGKNGHIAVSNGDAKNVKESDEHEANGKMKTGERLDEALQPCKGIDDY